MFTLITLILIGVMFLLIPWIVHIMMIIDSDMQYGWASYNTFKREFSKYKWSHDGVFENSLFDNENDCKIHASIYKFNHKGMIMYSPFEYYKSVLHIKNHCKVYRKPKRKIIDWNEIN